MKVEQPSYYAIIPATVRYCKALPANAKLLYGEITALASTDRGCFARNKYFADLFNVDVRTIARWINLLEELGFIERDLPSTTDGSRVIRLKNHHVPQEIRQKRESYQQIMDDFFVDKILQQVMWEFIKHCQLANRPVTNDKLKDILVRLDMAHGHDETSKIQSVKRAINKGYFDIAEE